MSEYVARHENCITPAVAPDANLRAYARENGLQTALIAAKFSGTQKLYTYWGHTGIKPGDIVEVKVPRRSVIGSVQETVRVCVWAAVPTTQFKNGAPTRTAKHLLRVHRPASSEAVRISDGRMLQTWYNQVLRDIEPMPKTEHAKQCVSEIDGMLGVDPAVDGMLSDSVDIDYKIDPAHRREYCADLEHMPLEELRKAFQRDFDQLTGTLPDKRSVEKQHRFAERFSMGPDSFLKMLDAQRGKAVPIERFDPSSGTWEGKTASIDNLPRMKAHRPTFRLSELAYFGQCGRQPKETPMSAKIENVTFVTLPNGSRYDAKNLTAQQFFDAIASLEAEVTKLDKIGHKPRALQQRIDELNGQIEQLSALCDSLHAAKEEPKTDSLGVPYGSADAATANEA